VGVVNPEINRLDFGDDSVQDPDQDPDPEIVLLSMPLHGGLSISAKDTSIYPFFCFFFRKGNFSFSVPVGAITSGAW